MRRPLLSSSPSGPLISKKGAGRELMEEEPAPPGSGPACGAAAGAPGDRQQPPRPPLALGCAKSAGARLEDALRKALRRERAWAMGRQA